MCEGTIHVTETFRSESYVSKAFALYGQTVAFFSSGGEQPGVCWLSAQVLKLNIKHSILIYYINIICIYIYIYMYIYIYTYIGGYGMAWYVVACDV